MRGTDRQTAKLVSYLSPEALVPPDHPLRQIRRLANATLDRLSPEFDAICAQAGRPSIPPESLLRALLVQAFFSVRSGRQLMEQLAYNMMFRWFVGLSMDAPIWDVRMFTKNRGRLLDGDIARKFLAEVLADPNIKPLLSDDHFPVDGTMIDAWASMKSFRPKDGGGAPPASGRNGEKLSNETHASTTDPDARLYRKAKGQPARLCHLGHVAMENRNGLVVAACVTSATGTAEREGACAMVEELGGNERITRHPGYAVSLRKRKRTREVFGWMKTAAGMRKTRHRGTARVGWMFTLTAAAYNLARMPKLLGAAA